MKAELTEEHAFLQKLIGTWEVDAADPDGKIDHGTWTETVRSLHGLWFLCEGEGTMPGGGAAATLLTLGYDPDKRKYTGTWVGSMMNHMWAYEGALDHTGRTLLLDTSGPDFEHEGQSASYREAITLINDNERTFTSSVRQPDGSWKEFMIANYRRKQ
jgi:surface antigen